MKNVFKATTFFILICIIVACDNAFSPNAPFEPKMVVYSILSTKSDSQFVRVYSTYNPKGNDPTSNPDENPIQDATVTLTDGSVEIPFRLLEIERPDKSRYSSPIQAYFAYPLKVEPGKTYQLSVFSPTYGTVTSNATIPEKGSISVSIVNPALLEFPWGQPQQDINLSLTLSSLARAFLICFYVEYESLYSNGIARTEVPLNMKVISCLYGEYLRTFPILTKRTTPTSVGPRTAQPQEHLSFENMSYRKTLEQIYDGGINVKFKRVVFYLIQFDDPFYKYYSVANSYKDKYSTRLDEPLYTNIQNGIGVFGSITIDSTEVVLPENIRPPDSRICDR